MTRPHSVLMDHRERQSQLAEFIAGDPQWQAEFAHMAVGDYLLDGRILIERKSLIDLAASIKDGRLFRQSIRLAAATSKGIRQQRRALMERQSPEGEAGLAESSNSADAEMQAHGTSVPTGILQGTSRNRSERFECKAHGAQEPQCTAVHEDFEHRATPQSDRAVGF